MQIHRQRVHGDHFIGLGSDEVRQPLREAFMVADPRVLGPEMPLHPVFGPVVQLRSQGRLCSLGLEPERIACEVDHVGSSVLGDMKITPSSG